MGKRSYYCSSRHQRTYLAMVYHNTTRTWLIQYHSMLLSSRSDCFSIETSRIRLVAAIEKLTTEPIKGEDKYLQGQLKIWKEHFKTNLRPKGTMKTLFFTNSKVLNRLSGTLVKFWKFFRSRQTLLRSTHPFPSLISFQPCEGWLFQKYYFKLALRFNQSMLSPEVICDNGIWHISISK